MKLELKNVSFSYDGQKPVLKDIDFCVETGQVVCVLGPNGIGKSTLLSCMAKLIIPSSGMVELDGRPMPHLSHQEVAQKIGYVPQVVKPSFDYTVLEYVVTGWAPWLGIFEKPGEEAYSEAFEALRTMNIAHLADKSYSRLSGGELQQVSIARAITQRAQILLMDEPTAHLDYGNQLKVLGMVKDLQALGMGIVLTTHNPDQVLILDADVAVLDRQADFHFGSLDEILTEELLSSIYQTKLKLINVAGLQRKICIAPDLDEI